MAATKEGPKTHDLKLTNASAFLLREAISAPQWYEGKGLDLVGAAIGVTESLSDHIPPKDVDNDALVAVDNDALVAWEKKPRKLVLTEKQRDACKVCVEWHLGKGNLRLSAPVGVLCRELGIG